MVHKVARGRQHWVDVMARGPLGLGPPGLALGWAGPWLGWPLALPRAGRLGAAAGWRTWRCRGLAHLALPRAGALGAAAGWRTWRCRAAGLRPLARWLARRRGHPLSHCLIK